jgi:hypothetical protein
MSRKLQIRALLIIGAAIILVFLAYRILANPPIPGYYRSILAATFDGSTGYLHFHDGVVDVLNIGGSGGDSKETIGAYKTVNRSEVHIVFFSRYALAPQTVSIGWIGFDFSMGFAQGMPDGDHCYREVLPWQLHRLKKLR